MSYFWFLVIFKGEWLIFRWHGTFERWCQHPVCYGDSPFVCCVQQYTCSIQPEGCMRWSTI